MGTTRILSIFEQAGSPFLPLGWFGNLKISNADKKQRAKSRHDTHSRYDFNRGRPSSRDYLLYHAHGQYTERNKTSYKCSFRDFHLSSQTSHLYDRNGTRRRVGESLKIPRQIMIRVGNLGGICKEDVAPGTRGGADGYRDASILLDCLPQRLHADVGVRAQCSLRQWVDPT